MIAVPCFFKNTLISTPHGRVRVQDLAIGDCVLSSGDKSVSVKFIGTRRLVKSGPIWPEDIEPVIIRRNALGKGIPERDLLVSPEHAIYRDGLFFEARELVNNHSIVRMGETEIDGVEYFHIDLGFHDLVYAEGAATESFGGATRDYFDNAADFYRLYGFDAAVKYEPFARFAFSFRRNVSRIGSTIGAYLPPSIQKLGRPVARKVYDQAHKIEQSMSVDRHGRM